MGLILDSSVLVASERLGKNAHQTLSAIAGEIGETDIGISVISIIELAHGAARANSQERKTKRDNFIGELLAVVPIYPVTVPIALRAGLLDGENHARGIRLALPDLVIAMTALELGYGVGTANLRHFKQVAGLNVVQL